MKTGISEITRIHEIAKGFGGRSNLQGFVAIVFDWAVVVLSWLVSIVAYDSQLFVPIYICCVIIIASRMRGLENLVHEASHLNLFASRALNDDLELFFALPVFRIVKDYRETHFQHHKHLGDCSRDPDIQRYDRLGVNNLTDDNWLWIILIRPLLGYHTIEYLQTIFLAFWHSPSSRWTKVGLWITVLAVVTFLNGWFFFALLWMVPFFLVLPVMRFWAEAAEHSNVDWSHEIGSARSNIGVLHRWFIHPHNDGFHAIHHFDPCIPWYSLKRAHQRLMKEHFYRQCCVESQGIFSTFRQMRTSSPEDVHD